MGAALAYGGSPARFSQTQRSIASSVGVASIVVAVFCLKSSSRFPGWWALLPSVGACLIIAAGSGAWANRAILARPLTVGIGLISFPLYLWHWPLLTLGRGAVPDTTLGRVGLLLSSAALAWATYALVEKPLRFGGRARLKALSLGALMLVIACIAGTIYKGAGYPTRYPEFIQNATQYDLDGYRTGMRWRKCFLDTDQDASQLAHECVEQGNKPLLVLWGDSGAASLYPGFREGVPDVRMAQFTASSCPPILAYTSDANLTCSGKNRKALEMITKLKPEIVVLTAIWLNYTNDIAQLADTIANVRRLGVRHVVILGPVPAWKDTPSRIVFRLWQEDPLHLVPSTRLGYRKFGLYEDDPVPRSERLEIALRNVAGESGATYVSALAALCNDQGCQTRASSKGGESFYLDIVHLNRTGAEFVVKAIADQLAFVESRKDTK